MLRRGKSQQQQRQRGGALADAAGRMAQPRTAEMPLLKILLRQRRRTESRDDKKKKKTYVRYCYASALSRTACAQPKDSKIRSYMTLLRRNKERTGYARQSDRCRFRVG